MLAPRGTDQSQCRARPRHSARCQRRGGHDALRTANYNSAELCFVYLEFDRGKGPGKRNAWIILYAVLPVAASLQNWHFVMRNQTNRKNKILWSDISRILFLCLSKKRSGSFLVLNGIFGLAGLVPQSSAPNRSSVAVGSKKVVRYGRPAGMRAALSPKTREKAVAD